MPPEIIEAIGPLSGGGVAGAIAYAIVKVMEIKAQVPQLRAEVEQLRRGHLSCEERSARLEARIDELLDRVTGQG